MRQDPAARHGDDKQTSDPDSSADASDDTSIATTSGADADKRPAPAPGRRNRFPKREKEDDGAGSKDDDAQSKKSGGRLGGPAKKVRTGADLVRSRIASVVWLLAVLAAIVLAVGALLIALGANEQNPVVESVLDLANELDGPFWKVFDFTEKLKNGKVVHDETKEHLVNWGLAAVAYLIGGRILDRIIRP